jgi:hypothetical protein
VWARGPQAIVLRKGPLVAPPMAPTNGSVERGAPLAMSSQTDVAQEAAEQSATSTVVPSIEAAADIERIVSEIRTLAQRLDELDEGAAPLETIDALRAAIGAVLRMLNALPNRLAEAMTVAFRTQHGLIVSDVRTMLLEFGMEEVVRPAESDA